MIRPSVPRAFSIDGFTKAYDVGRTKTFELIKEGHLRAVKCGSRTLILADDAELWAKSLPSVQDAVGDTNHEQAMGGCMREGARKPAAGSLAARRTA